MKERQPFDRRLGLKAKLEAKKHVDMAGYDPVFQNLEPLYPPTEKDIKQKQEFVKRKKRDK